MNQSLTHRIAEVRSRIVHACERSGRDPQSVQLLLASKTVDALIVREAFHTGVSLFGENKSQELLDKLPSLTDLPIEWHFIGQLQTNKVKAILQHVQLIHSMDRISLAEEIQRQAERLSIHVNVLIEVNSSGETNKGGISIAEAPRFAAELKAYNRIQVQGLMTVAVDGAPKEVRDCFHRTQACLTEIGSNISGNILSMGMSGDFELAIEEGSTLVRIGSSAFGKRA